MSDKKQTPVEQPFPERPVRCMICREKMYYHGDPQHEPEVVLSVTSTITDLDGGDSQQGYAHVRCWNVATGYAENQATKQEARP